MLSFRIRVKKWGEGQGIITGYEGLKIARDLIPGIIYSSKTSRVCTGCVNIISSAVPCQGQAVFWPKPPQSYWLTNTMTMGEGVYSRNTKTTHSIWWMYTVWICCGETVRWREAVYYHPYFLIIRKSMRLMNEPRSHKTSTKASCQLLIKHFSKWYSQITRTCDIVSFNHCWVMCNLHCFVMYRPQWRCSLCGDCSCFSLAVTLQVLDWWEAE